MHPELRAVFDEHAQPMHASKRDVHDQSAPIHRLSGNVLKQVFEYRLRIGDAEMAPHDHALDGKLELMHQTFGALEREASTLMTASRELAKAMTQLDRYVAEWRADIDSYEAMASAPAVTPIIAPDVG